ncbi:MAG: dihydropteroate synthase [Candidatus Brocadiia bacterium]
MIVIAERINATREPISLAMNERDAAHIAEETKLQERCGADYIDINGGNTPDQEVENLSWAVEIVQQNTDLPLCIDSAGAEGFEAALEKIHSEDVMLNSVNGESEKMEKILPIAAERSARLVALLMDEEGLPSGVDDRLQIAEKIVEQAEKAGVALGKLYVDPCVQPLCTNPDQANAVIECVGRVMEDYPGIHTTGGLSNISFGLPYRGVVNRAFITFLIGAGLDSGIVDPTSQDMMATILAAEAICEKDEMCMNYIKADRQGLLRPDEIEA